MKASWRTFFGRGVRQVRQHGLRLLVERYIRRAAILRTAPVACPPEAPLEVHMQICRRDWLNGLWTLKSLRRVSGAPFRLVLLDDGSIGTREREIYRTHFPGLVEAATSGLAARVERELRPRAPHIADLWATGIYFTLPKVVDSWLLARNDTILCVDPDVLFFCEPIELLEATRGGLEVFALFNHRPGLKHRDGSYCLDLDRLRTRWGIEFPLGFIIGLGALRLRDIDWPFLDEVCRGETIPHELRFMADQTLTALGAFRGGGRVLPAQRYAVDPVGSLDGVVARHYFGKTRDLFYLEGLPALIAAGLTRRAS
jgi:hypothetical protein